MAFSVPALTFGPSQPHSIAEIAGWVVDRVGAAARAGSGGGGEAARVGSPAIETGPARIGAAAACGGADRRGAARGEATVGKSDRRAIVLVDGPGGSGKSTFARRLVGAINAHEPTSVPAPRPHANLVAVDDVSWWLHPLNWADAMLDGVVGPWLAGQNVDYRPPGWVEKGRPGSIKATAAALGEPGQPVVNILVIEGMAAARSDLASMASYIIWINTDPQVARDRLIARDLELGENGGTLDGVTQFTEAYDATIAPLYARERPWERADLVVNLTTVRPDGLFEVVRQ